MTALLLNPFPMFYDQLGQPLDEGYIYVGEVNKDPRQFPINIYLDVAKTNLAVQPLRTINGVLSNGYKPIPVFTDAENYSVLVLDKNQAQVFYDKSSVTSNFGVTGALEYIQELTDTAREEILNQGFVARVYSTPSDGVAAGTGVPNGKYFNARSGDPAIYALEYLNNNGTPQATGKTYPTLQAWTDALAAVTATASQKTTDLTTLGNAKIADVAATGEQKKTQLSEIAAAVSGLNAGQEFFQTETALKATTPSVTGKVAKALDTKKVWYWNGSAWVDTGLSELDQAKSYADANPLFKAGTIVAGNDFNSFTKSGLYVQWGNLAAGQLSNAPLVVGGQHPSGVLVVSNVSGNIATQIFYPYLDTSKPMIRANATTSTFGAWDTFVFESTRYVRKDLTSGQDVLTLPTGRYKIPSRAIGDTLLNMPSAQYKYGIIDVDTIASSTIIRFVPYGRDTNFYMNASYESGQWSGWQTFSPTATLSTMFATPAALSTAIAASLDNVAGTKFFGQQYTDTELNGTKLYTNGRYVGLNSITSTDAAVFNAVKTRIFNTDTGDIQYRVYLAPSVTTNGPDGYAVTNVANYSFSGICKSFPRNDTGSAQTILLDKVITIPANTAFVIVFKNVNFVQFGIGNHATVTGNLESRGFNLSTSTADWSALSAIGNAGVSLNYVQAGFQLLIALASTSSGSSGGGSTYTPALVMPPKIHVLAGLQAHIYPEHLLPENHDLYLHDITCTLGKQVKRGWVYDVPTTQAAGNNTLTWAIADRQTGVNITSASTTVVVAPQTTSGTKNVLVIGDSYINAGVITQRLLDIAATDPLKVNLIGTRGTAPNKHEGRGGWTIGLYTSAGIINYQFTVSGVSQVPSLNATTYTYGGSTFLVQELNMSGGNGTILCSLSSGSAPTAGSTGTLTKSNGSAGDATIAFSNVQSVPGNPFWISGALNFSQYLTNNSLTTPDVVIIELGVNDCFSLTSDAAVETFTATAFSQLDSLIASIKSANSSVKIGLAIPSVYANQDAFGIGYACGQTAWRAKRNIVTWNRKLIAYYSGKEAQNIYLVASGLNVDTVNNFPTVTQAINSQNANTVTVQNNGVHPDVSGYKQIGDALFAFLKAV